MASHPTQIIRSGDPQSKQRAVLTEEFDGRVLVKEVVQQPKSKVNQVRARGWRSGIGRWRWRGAAKARQGVRTVDMTEIDGDSENPDVRKLEDRVKRDRETNISPPHKPSLAT
ncbi:hypothetical protein ACSQ67_019401 [Phaseolus vulgaris]